MIQWLTENYINIFAAIGALYAAARLIVALTPTPADDAAVETVGTWLKKIATLFGLDLTQGINKKE